jgi:excisionase family DNA binding protein
LFAAGLIPLESGRFFVLPGGFMKINQHLLAGKEVAEFLRLSRQHTYKLLRDGVIPSIRVGKSVRVRSQDLQAFVDGQLNGGQIGSATSNPVSDHR